MFVVLTATAPALGAGDGDFQGSGDRPGTMMRGFTDIDGDGDWDGHHDWDDGWWIVMMIGMVLFWVLVAVAIVWVVRNWNSGGRPGADGLESPLDLLDRRFAEGVISIEEYEQRKRILSGGNGAPPEQRE